MAHSHSLTDYPGQIVGIAAIAAGIGAVTAMLITPRSGPQIRSNLKQRTRNMREAFNNSADELSATGLDTLKDVSAKAKKVANTSKEVTDQSSSNSDKSTKT